MEETETFVIIYREAIYYYFALIPHACVRVRDFITGGNRG